MLVSEFMNSFNFIKQFLKQYLRIFLLLKINGTRFIMDEVFDDIIYFIILVISEYK